MARKKKIYYIATIILLASIVLINQFTLALFTDNGKIDSNDILFFIWLYDITILFFSIFFIVNKGSLKKSFKYLIFIFYQILIVFILVEVGLQTYFYIKHKLNPQHLVFNEIIGWQNTPYVSKVYNSDLWGSVIYTTKEYGFRKFGDTNTTKFKIFVIGDSFTMADNITDGKTYYDKLLENKNIELFAYGGGGYGTLQQYLILDKYFDKINPDLVIWQFCDNDIINNDNDLEGRSLLHSGIDPRPYYINGKIVVLSPWLRHSKIYNILYKSYIIQIMSLELKLFQQNNAVTIEKVITKDDPLFTKSYNTTEQIMTLVLNRLEGIPLISFNAKIYDDFPSWWSNTFNKIAEKQNFTFLQQVTDSLTIAKENGFIIDGYPIDEHWNQKGHEIVGQVLLNFLEENDYLP